MAKKTAEDRNARPAAKKTGARKTGSKRTAARGAGPKRPGKVIRAIPVAMIRINSTTQTSQSTTGFDVSGIAYTPTLTGATIAGDIFDLSTGAPILPGAPAVPYTASWTLTFGDTGLGVQTPALLRAVLQDGKGNSVSDALEITLVPPPPPSPTSSPPE